MNALTRLALCFCLTLAAATPAAATPAAAVEAPAAPPLHLDVEVDPTAYVLGGYSVHLGLGYGKVRLDLGLFAMDVPEAIHGNKGYDASFDGFGAKLQFFPFAEGQRGGFVGVGAGNARIKVDRRGTDLSSRERSFSAGVEVGWRFDLIAGLYATPWLGLDYSFDASDVRLGDGVFEQGPWQLFPAVHLGYQFL